MDGSEQETLEELILRGSCICMTEVYAACPVRALPANRFVSERYDHTRGREYRECHLGVIRELTIMLTSEKASVSVEDALYHDERLAEVGSLECLDSPPLLQVVVVYDSS